MTERAEPPTIRPAEIGDTSDVAALWCEAFPGPRTPAERARMLETGGRYGGLETVLVARDPAGGLVAACKIYRMTEYIAGVAMPMMGLAAVAVAPGARRRGIGARLCREAVAAARDRGDVLSALYPFRPDYYERLGWGLVGELYDHRFAAAALPGSDHARHVRPARGAADAAAIADCYERVASSSNGPIRRDDRVWAWRLAGEEMGVRPAAEAGGGRERAVVHDRDGVAGYALLRPARSRDRPALHVRELVADSEAAYRGLLGWLAGRAGRWPVMRHTARPEERFGDRLVDPRPPGAPRARSLYFPTARVIRGPMLRLLDVPGALRLRRFFDADPDPTARPAAVALEVRVDDIQIPSNAGPWRVTIDRDGTATVAALTGAGAPDGPDGSAARVAAPAAALARIFAGELAPRDAARLGLAEVEGDVVVLDRAFATRDRFWLLDEF